MDGEFENQRTPRVPPPARAHSAIVRLVSSYSRVAKRVNGNQAGSFEWMGSLGS
jgi:hypothetical protein